MHSDATSVIDYEGWMGWMGWLMIVMYGSFDDQISYLTSGSRQSTPFKSLPETPKARNRL
jgi:hypothetical protein